MEFDSFDALNELVLQPFSFNPSRFELWQDQKIISSGVTNGCINAKIENDTAEFEFENEELSQFIESQISFDKLVMATDRLRYINIPSNTNIWSNGFDSLETVYGNTRESKIFTEKEPYCCNIFLAKGLLSKITFSFSNPVRLLEFYSEDRQEVFFKNKIHDSNFISNVEIAQTEISNESQIVIFNSVQEFTQLLEKKLLNKFSEETIEENLTIWFDDDFIEYLSYCFQIGIPYLLIKKNFIKSDINLDEKKRLICHLCFLFNANLSMIFCNSNTREYIYDLQELSEQADRCFNLLGDENIESKIDFLYSYYIS
jgi:hypothetical protein